MSKVREKGVSWLLSKTPHTTQILGVSFIQSLKNFLTVEKSMLVLKISKNSFFDAVYPVGIILARLFLFHGNRKITYLDSFIMETQLCLQL